MTARVARLRGPALMTVLVVTIALLVAMQFRGSGRGAPAAAARPWAGRPPASARVDVGVVTQPFAVNSWRPWRLSDLETVNTWEQLARKHASVVMWYADWQSAPPSLRQLQAIARRGSIAEITWEPWRSFRTAAERAHGSRTPVRLQPRFKLRNIAAGRFDPYVRSWARRLAAFDQPVRLRFAQEMNGGWYPWSEDVNGNRPGDFVRAWRHVHSIFRAAGATKVRWVWAPAAIAIRAGLYPGDRYVDMVGLTLFNGGLQLRYNAWRPFAQIVGAPLRRLHAIAPRKPVELSEVGCAERGGSKSWWISGMFTSLRRRPEITSIIWFDIVKGSDWRISSSAHAAAAFAAGVSDPRYR
jgi:mannan endo-1,4-beta-mannosidase